MKIRFTTFAVTSIKSYVPANFLFSQCKVVPGACFGPQSLPGTPFLSLFRLKEPKRGWKSDVRTLSWNSGWKPLKKREFWHQRISDIFFRLEVMAVWSWNSCVSYFHHYNYSFSSIDLTKSRYACSLTAVGWLCSTETLKMKAQPIDIETDVIRI